MINIHAPLIKKRVKGRGCSWLSTEVIVIMNTRDKLERLEKTEKRQTD